MPWPTLAIVASLLGTEPTAFAHEADEAPVALGKRLAVRTIDALVELDELAITIDIGEASESEHGGVDATITVNAIAHHSLDATIGELELGVALLPEPDLAFVWDRLHTPPLQLTTEQIERKLPSALAVVSVVDDGDPFAHDLDRPIGSEDQFEGLRLPRALPSAIAMVTTYSLDAPSERDVLRLLADGGPTDLGALAAWASALAVDGTEPFDAAARTRIVDAVEKRLRELRAPPAFGDFQRINALTALAYACAGPGDLERMLVLQRPVSILLSGAIVSYDDAVGEENALGLPVHGFRRMYSRSDASLSWEGGMQRVRGLAIDHLLELAFDPLDFRAAPPTMRRHPTLHVGATELLAPLDAADVGRALALAGDRVAVQKGVLRFYVEVGHAPVVEPLIDWLVANPDEVEELGHAAMVRMGAAMLPVLLRRFGDFEAPSHERMVVWRLLAALPERHAPALAEVCGSIGVELPAHAPGTTPTVAELLLAIRTADELAQQRRVADLIERIRDGDDDRVSLHTRVEAAHELAELAPPRLQEVADEVIALHVAAARDLATDGPSGPRVIVSKLRALPLGDHTAAAMRAAALIDAEQLVAQGDRDAALATLEHADPELADAELRARYLAIVEQHYRELVGEGAWDGATLLLDRAEALGLDELEIDRRRASIFAMKRRPWVALGVVIALTLLMAVVFVLHRSGAIARLRARWIARKTTDDASALDEPQGEELAEAWDRRDDDTRSPLDDFAA